MQLPEKINMTKITIYIYSKLYTRKPERYFHNANSKSELNSFEKFAVVGNAFQILITRSTQNLCLSG